MKKVIVVLSIIAIVIIGACAAYIIYKNNMNKSIENENNEIIEYTASENKEANIDEYPDPDEILKNIYDKVKNKNINLLNLKSGEQAQEYITEYGFNNNKFEIKVKVYYIKEIIENNITYYQIFSNKDFSQKIAEVSKADYDEAMKDNSIDGINNYSLDGLIDTNKLKSYKYVLSYDKASRKVTFKEFVEQ